MKKFNRDILEKQYKNIEWITQGVLCDDELLKKADKLTQNSTNLPKATAKAKTLELILKNAKIAIDKDDIFQDKIYSGDIMLHQREYWEQQIVEAHLKNEAQFISDACQCGAYCSYADYGHTSPDSAILLELGLPGLIERIDEASKKEGLSEKQLDFYESCRIVLNAMISVIKRFEKAIAPYDTKCAQALKSIANGAPQNSYEAMQLIILYFFIHEYVAGTRVRTLGRLDVLLYPFYKNDIQNGTYSKEEIREMLKFFLFKFSCANVPFGLPFCISGLDSSGNDVTSEITYLIAEVYNELDIYSPKIHVRVSDKTPEDFIKLVLSYIRNGISSFVFVGDNTVIKSLESVGISKTDAQNYVPIGCYEPAVWGMEIGCTGNGYVNMPKAVEFVFTNGKDLKGGKLLGVETGKIYSYEQFLSALKKQLEYMTNKALEYIVSIEKYYGDINPDPILSSMYYESVMRGVDVYEGGAKYNNSSMYFYSIASFVDSVIAVKKFVFDEKRVTFDEFGKILENNWSGNEKLCLIAKSMRGKYGNAVSETDALTKDIAQFCASLVNNKPNGRGGVFKASCFSINHCFDTGKKTMATPDGRMAGEPLSKNLCAVNAMDKKGITALINSVTVFDHALYPNGSVLDVVLHPSAVSGQDGLEAFYGVLKTYLAKGGMALHGNVFEAKDLIAAQKNPEKYKNLQVRVCGWNAHFINLSKEEQDAFIEQAQNSANN